MDTEISPDRGTPSRMAGSRSKGAPAGRIGRGRFVLLALLVTVVACSYLAFRQDQLNRALLAAAQDVDATAVHRALNAGADPNIRLDYASQEREGLIGQVHSLFNRRKRLQVETIPLHQRT